MSVSPAIFESAGKRTEHYIPGVYSRSNNITSPSGVNAGNMVILGSSSGGEPGTLLTFSSLSEAKDTLVNGELLKAVGYCFKASNEYIPQNVSVMRVNKGVQSSVELNDSNGEKTLRLKSWDYGAHTNLVKVWIQEGTKSNSYKISVGYKDDVTTIDNIQKPSLTLQYIGEGESATATFNTDSVKLQGVDADGNTIDKLEVSYDDCETIAELVTRINDSGLYQAVVVNLESNAKSKELDTTLATGITDETTFYSNLYAVIEALESITYIGEVELLSTTVRQVPVLTDGYVYFTGGLTPAEKLSDYIECIEKLTLEDIQIISTPSTDKAVHALIAAHCTEMSSTINRKERTAILGCGIGDTDENNIAETVSLNNRLVSFVGDCGTAVNPVSGETENISGAMIACMLAAMESSMAVNESLTFKSLNLSSVTNRRTNSNIENLIKAGVVVVNPNPENASELVVIRSMTTYQGDNDLIDCERSMVREDLYMNRDLRSRFVNGIGHPNDTSESKILTTLHIAAKEWADAGYIQASDNGYVFDEKVKFSGDKVYLTYSRYLTAPRNFVFITATNLLYESTVEL